MNKNGTKLYKQGQLNGYTYCIRQIFEENTLGFSHSSGNATKLNNNCHGFATEEQNGKLGAPVPARLYTSPATLVDGSLVGGRKEQRRQRRAALSLPSEGKLRFADRLRALLKRENHQTPQPGGTPQDPYDFSEAPSSACVAAAAAPLPQQIPVSAPLATVVPVPAVSEAQRTVENGSLGRQGSELALNHRSAQPQAKILPKEVPVHQTQQLQRVPVVSQPLSSVSFAKGTTVFGLAEVKPKVVATSSGGTAAVCSSGTGIAAASGGTAKLSKTMNRLQAKIAQNRVLDKLKRAQQDTGGHTSSPSSHNHNHRVMVSSSASSVSSSLLAGAAFGHDRHEVVKTGVLSRPRERPGRDRRIKMAPVAVAPTAATTDLATTPAQALSNLRRFWNAEKNSGTEEAQAAAVASGSGGGGSGAGVSGCGVHQLPGAGSLGGGDLDSSDSDSSEDEDGAGDRAPFLWNWDLDCSDASTVRSVRSLRINRLRAELRKRYEVLCKRHAAARPALERQDALVRHMARAAELCPDAAARFLMNDGATTTTTTTSTTRPKPMPLEKRTCCYKHENVACSMPALPYTRHCTKHIMYNVDQLLFEHCTAKFADNTQCCVPVFDMCHELPLCPEHAKKRDNYDKMAAEPKPKKPRKKSKPPALTRPPKRGKKKKSAAPGMTSPPPMAHSPSSSSFSSCVPLEVLIQSPVSSSSSSSPCSSRSPPFLGGSDSSPALLGSLVTPTVPSAQASALTAPPIGASSQQPLLQMVATGCPAVRIKTEPKSPVMLHHSLPSSSTSTAHTMPVLTSHPMPRSTPTSSHVSMAAAAAAPHVLASTTRTMTVHHPPLPVPAATPTTAGHLVNASAASMMPAATHPSSAMHLATGAPTVVRAAAVNPSHMVGQAAVAVPHSTAIALEQPAAAVVGTLGATSMVESYGYVPVLAAASSINADTVAKELVERIEPDLATDLENQFSPDTIEKSLELPLDAAELANQATKLLEEHDFTEVLNKISDDAFSDFFAEAKNGEYVPSKEETEELERALAAVSKDVSMARESLAKLSAAGAGQGDVPDLPDLVDAFPDLPLSTSDINSLTQALMGGEALRTVALLSSADQGFTLLEQPPFVPQQQTTAATAEAPAISASTSGWLLGSDFATSSPATTPEVPTQGSTTAAVLPKRSVLAQESVS